MPPPPHSEITEWVREKQIDRWDSLGWNSFDPKADAEMASSKFNFESTRSGNPTYFQAKFGFSPRIRQKKNRLIRGFRIFCRL